MSRGTIDHARLIHGLVTRTFNRSVAPEVRLEACRHLVAESRALERQLEAQYRESVKDVLRKKVSRLCARWGEA